MAKPVSKKILFQLLSLCFKVWVTMQGHNLEKKPQSSPSPSELTPKGGHNDLKSAVSKPWRNLQRSQGIRRRRKGLGECDCAPECHPDSSFLGGTFKMIRVVISSRKSSL